MEAGKRLLQPPLQPGEEAPAEKLFQVPVPKNGYSQLFFQILVTRNTGWPVLRYFARSKEIFSAFPKNRMIPQV